MAKSTPSLTERRLKWAKVAVLIFFVAIVGRLFQYQIFQSAQINEQSAPRRLVTTTIPALRGDIVDSKGKILATTVMSYDITVDPTQVQPYTSPFNGKDVLHTVDEATQSLASILQLDPAVVAEKLKGTSHYSLIAKQVDGATYLRIKNLDIPWVYFVAVPHRVYPNGALLGNLLGFIGTEGKPLEGLELSEDKCLAGVDGKETYTRSADGIRIPGTAAVTVEPKNGGRLQLTINSDLQYYAQQVMAKYVKDERADWGSAIVVEAKTGKILAAAEAPTVDPNEYWAVSADARSSRIFRTTFEPGSTIKTLTAATAIDQGVATPLTKVIAPQSTKILGDFRISDSHAHPTEHLTLQGVLIESSNTGIIQVGIKVPYATRADYWNKFGLGQRTAVDFPGEGSGIVHQTAPDGASVYTSMFGQAMTVTPIQTAYIYQSFANGGTRLPAKLLDSCTAVDGTELSAQRAGNPVQVLKPSTARQVVDMLENNVAQKGGIGSTAAIPGYRMGGKSGTAQIIDNQGRYGTLHAISFIGMAPAEDPKYVLAVTIYKPRTVSNSIGATPPFKAILEQVLRTYRVPPSTTKSPLINAHW